MTYSDGAWAVPPPPSRSAIRLAGGGTYAGCPTTNISTLTINTNGYQSATPLVIASPVHVEAVGIEVVTGAAGATVRPGIYADNAGMPDQLLLDAGSLAATAAGWVEAPADLDLGPGVYWLANALVDPTLVLTVRAQAVAVPIGSTAPLTTSQNLLDSQQINGGVTGALPSPWGAAPNPGGFPGQRVLIKIR